MSVANVTIAGRYRLLAVLGRGGMGQVWLARDEVLGRDVAVKEVHLPEDLTPEDHAELVQRTLREARTAGRLSHPNVVQIYDVLHVDGRPWIVMEYVRARSLQEVIKQEGALAVARVAQIGLALLAALRAAHRAGVLHRDVKPANVLIAEDGRVVLTDFGLAMFDGGDGTVTRAGLVLGSPLYISPERASQGLSSPESDLWSLGATLYAAVEGRAPYARTTTMATLSALATSPPDQLLRAGALEPVLRGLLQKDPGARTPAAEVDRLLRPIAAGAVKRPGSRRPWTRVPRQREPRERREARQAREAGQAREWLEAGLSSQAPVLRAASPSTPRPGDTTAVVPAAQGAVVPAAQGAVVPAAQGAVVPVAQGADAAVDGPTSRLPRPDDDATARVPARPSPPRRPLWRRPWVAIGVTVALLALVGTVLAFGTTGDLLRGPSSAANSPSPGTSDVVKPEPTRSDEYALPEGWVWRHDPAGFRIAVPDGWTTTRTESTVYFREPGGGRVLHVDGWTPQDRDLVGTMTRAESHEMDQLPSYQRIRIETQPQYFQSCAVWEYTYDGDNGTHLHAIEWGFLTAPNQGYTIGWSTREFDWQVNMANFWLVTASFRPPT